MAQSQLNFNTKSGADSVAENTPGGALSLREAVDAYERLSGLEVLNDTEGPELAEARRRIGKAQEFVEVTQAEEFQGIHRRLFDAVHPSERQEQLVARLGGMGSNKRVFAMAVQTGDGEWFPTAVVYTYWSDRPEPHGNIRRILDEPVRKLRSVPKRIVPYTISSNFPGAGRDLIFGLHNYVYNRLGLAGKAMIATLSPLRTGVPGNEKAKGFATWLNRQVSVNPDDREELERSLWTYLTPDSEGIKKFRALDPVQYFHMGYNGAVLAGIFPDNRDSPPDADLAYGMMVSYFYPPDMKVLKENIQRFRHNGLLAVTPELAARAPEELQDYILIIDPQSFIASEPDAPVAAMS